MSFITCGTWVNEIVCWNPARMKDEIILVVLGLETSFIQDCDSLSRELLL